MAEENSDGQEKTEDPTQKRIEKAREDGQIASSKELFVFTTLATGLLLYLAILMVAPQLLMEWRGFFNYGDPAFLIDDVYRLLGRAFWFIIINGTLFAIPLLLIVLATQAGMDGSINFAPGALAFKGSRINPLAGLKRMVSLKALVEMIKAVLKVTFLIGAAVLVLYMQLPKLIEAQSTHLTGALDRVHEVFLLLIAIFLLVLAGIAILDVLWQSYQHKQQLRMTRQELKDEHKQTEGSPEVKAKIRRMQMAVVSRAARQREALEEVPNATAIITNPTHFAVALKYEVGSGGAPIILAMGRGIMAEQIISRGEEAGVTVFRNPLLARALFFAGELGEEIPEQLYTAVAAVLAFIYRLAREDNVDAPEIELPDDMLFDEHGARMDATAR